MVQRGPIFFKTSKFMWDGSEYDSKEKSAEKKKEYEGLGFTVIEKEDDGKFFLYTRRVAQVTEAEEEKPA